MSTPAIPADAGPSPTEPEPGSSGDPLLDFEPIPPWATRGPRQTFRGKFASGLRGVRHAIRGDSSFFAHGYRGLLIALTAALLGIGPLSWCLLIVAAALVLTAEMAHSAVDTLARTLGNPEDPGLKAAREIATGGVLVAATTSGAVTVTVLTLRLGYLLGWWGIQIH